MSSPHILNIWELKIRKKGKILIIDIRELVSFSCFGGKCNEKYNWRAANNYMQVVGSQ